jgi:hypothetical protein
MFSATAYKIRTAADEDHRALERHASLVGASKLSGTVLVGEIAGTPAAAVSVSDGRVVADPFRSTDGLVTQLRSRARARQAYEQTPSTHDRIRERLRLAA